MNRKFQSYVMHRTIRCLRRLRRVFLRECKWYKAIIIFLAPNKWHILQFCGDNLFSFFLHDMQHLCVFFIRLRLLLLRLFLEEWEIKTVVYLLCANSFVFCFHTSKFYKKKNNSQYSHKSTSFGFFLFFFVQLNIHNGNRIIEKSLQLRYIVYSLL